MLPVRQHAFPLTQPSPPLLVPPPAAIFPMPVAPVYAASKAGVAHFVRSAGRGLARGPAPPVRLLALCPEFVETPLVTQLVKEVGYRTSVGTGHSPVVTLKWPVWRLQKVTGVCVVRQSHGHQACEGGGVSC